MIEVLLVIVIIETSALIYLGVRYRFKNLNKQSVERISGSEAKLLAKQGMEELTGITYAGGALTRFYREHVETGKIETKLPKLGTAKKKLQDSTAIDKGFLVKIIQYTHQKKVEISD